MLTICTNRTWFVVRFQRPTGWSLSVPVGKPLRLISRRTLIIKNMPLVIITFLRIDRILFVLLLIISRTLWSSMKYHRKSWNLSWKYRWYYERCLIEIFPIGIDYERFVSITNDRYLIFDDDRLLTTSTSLSSFFFFSVKFQEKCRTKIDDVLLEHNHL
jgi:hypothetical protein